MKNKAFTLIELLAVIIILGILMLIAIPSVTNYINNSRKNTYITTIDQLVKGTIAKVNSGELNLFDIDTTYYVPCTCIKLENGEAKSPYGKFDPAYVVVTFDGDNYHYYFTGKDVQNMGVPVLTSTDILSKESIVSNVSSIDTTVGIEGTTNVYVFSDECNGEGEIGPAGTTVSGGSSFGSGSSGSTSNLICKKATTLHSTKCQSNCTGISCGCGQKIGYGNTITYGTIPNGSKKAGDAYDCDVNNDGFYDEETERFYYVISDGDKSILIYYTNMNDQTRYAYDVSNENWHGPRTGYQYLPSTSEWSNPKIIAPGTRSLVAENGNEFTRGGTIEPFTYTDKAARFLTGKELVNACSSISSIEYSPPTGELDECTWLLENIGRYEYDESVTRANGYWLDTPVFENSNHVWNVFGSSRIVYAYYARYDASIGIRPVITVKTSNIET